MILMSKTLTGKDIREAAFRYMFMACNTFNYENQQGPAVVFGLNKALRKIYPNDEDYKASLNNHFKYFNTTTWMANLLLGASLAAVTRFGDDGRYRVESAKMLGTLLHMMKGTPYVFQGEELGMKDVPFESLGDYRDIESLNMIDELRSDGLSEDEIRRILYLRSRDNARTPMPWDDGFGFSSARPWIDYSADNRNINVNRAIEDPDSVFWYYRKLIKLRHTHDVIVDGRYRALNQDDSCVYSFTRTNEKEQLLVVCSFSEDPVRFEIPEEFADCEMLISSCHRTPCHGTVILKPYETFVISRRQA